MNVCANIIWKSSSQSKLQRQESCWPFTNWTVPWLVGFFRNFVPVVGLGAQRGSKHFGFCDQRWESGAGWGCRFQGAEIFYGKQKSGEFDFEILPKKNSQSGESFCLQVVTHSKKCSVYFIDKDSAEARWVGPKNQKKTPAVQTLFMKFRAAKVWSYPTQSVPESSRFAFGSGLGILIGSPGGHWGSPATGCYDWGCQVGLLNSSRTWPVTRRSESFPENMGNFFDIFQGTKQCLREVHLYKPLFKKRGKSILKLALICLQFYVGIHIWPLWFSLFLQAPDLISIPVCGHHLLLS